VGLLPGGDEAAAGRRDGRSRRRPALPLLMPTDLIASYAAAQLTFTSSSCFRVLSRFQVSPEPLHLILVKCVHLSISRGTLLHIPLKKGKCFLRIAVFSDVHGNPFAARAVLQDIAASGSYDAVASAGDICLGGSDPAGCVDLLREADVQSVYGNADEFVYNVSEEPPDEIYRARWRQTYSNSVWAAGKLGQDRLQWLRNLPFELRFSPTQNVRDDLLIVHANPKTVYHHILPSENTQKQFFGAVVQADSDPALLDMIEGVEAGVIAHGHLHYTCEREIGGLRCVNVAPCSCCNSFDSDSRARYTVFAWNGEWNVKRRYVEYDMTLESNALAKSGIPCKPD
jgi:predicted phosphodiesterase